MSGRVVNILVVWCLCLVYPVELGAEFSDMLMAPAMPVVPATATGVSGAGHRLGANRWDLLVFGMIHRMDGSIGAKLKTQHFSPEPARRRSGWQGKSSSHKFTLQEGPPWSHKMHRHIIT